jgi:hypothetical protein
MVEYSPRSWTAARNASQFTRMIPSRTSGRAPPRGAAARAAAPSPDLRPSLSNQPRSEPKATARSPRSSARPLPGSPRGSGQRSHCEHPSVYPDTLIDAITRPTVQLRPHRGESALCVRCSNRQAPAAACHAGKGSCSLAHPRTLGIG